MRFLGFVALAMIGCGGSVASAPTDGGSLDGGSLDSAPDVAVVDVSVPDVGPTSCATPNPLDPPLGCGPEESGAGPCSSTSAVATCPTDNRCMARVKQSAPVLQHRVGRLRLHAPEALLALAPIAFDPNVSAKCANNGSEGMSWLLQFDLNARSLRTGAARPSTDGATFAFLDESVPPEAAGSICPGFVGPSAPIDLRAQTTPFAPVGPGVNAVPIPLLTLASFDSTGSPILFPLHEARIRVGAIADPSCIGSWNRNYWCDGETLGWTTGGSIVAKISVEEADRIPIKSAGCQSLCAILVNDATKTEGKLCKRGSDGKIPPIGDACIGGEGCNNAWLFSATFGSYGVTIKP